MSSFKNIHLKIIPMSFIKTFAVSLLGAIFMMQFSCAPYSLPEQKTYTENEDPYAFFIESSEAYQAKNYQLALIKIQKAIELNSNLPQFYKIEGDIFRALYKDDQAMLSYRQAISKRSGFVDAHISIGEIHQKYGSYNEAVKSYKKVISLDPARLDVILMIVQSYIDWGELQVAEHQLDNYQKTATNLKQPVEDKYYLLRAEVFYQNKEYQNSLNILKNIRENNQTSLQLLGKNYYAIGDFETGVTCFNKLLKIDQKNGKWYLYRGIYFYSKKDFKDAGEQFKYALKLNDQLIEAHYYLGKIYMSDGNTSDAYNEFKIYRKQMRDFDRIEEVENLLNFLHKQ